MTTTVILGIAQAQEAQEIIQGIIQEENCSQESINLIKERERWVLHFASTDAEYRFKWKFDTRLAS